MIAPRRKTILSKPRVTQALQIKENNFQKVLIQLMVNLNNFRKKVKKDNIQQIKQVMKRNILTESSIEISIPHSLNKCK
jgi:hypothetical protein